MQQKKYKIYNYKHGLCHKIEYSFSDVNLETLCIQDILQKNSVLPIISENIIE